MTLHLEEGKQGVNIEKSKYDSVRNAIIDALKAHGDISFSDLGDAAGACLGDPFNGSVSWYYTTVKLDLEALGVVERVPGSRPQRLHLVQAMTVPGLPVLERSLSGDTQCCTRVLVKSSQAVNNGASRPFVGALYAAAY